MSRRRRRSSALSALGFVVMALSGRVEAATPLSALGRVAFETTRGFPEAERRSVVVVAAPLVTDQPAPRGNELALQVAALVAGQLPKEWGARWMGQTAPLPAARKLARSAAAMLFVQTEIVRGEVRVLVDLFPVTQNSWVRLLTPPLPPLFHAYAAVPIDAEVRRFLPPIVLEQAQVHHVAHQEADVLAVACGDVDGDGGMELLVVSRARVTVGRIRGRRFEVTQSSTWSSLAGRAPTPLREPLGGALVRPGHYFVGSSDRSGLSLGPTLVPEAPLLSGIPVPMDGAVACARAGDRNAFSGDVVSCRIEEGARGWSKLATPIVRHFDAFAHAALVDGTGKVHDVWANREPGGKLHWRANELTSTLEGVGAAVAVGDLDLDGAPEVAFSAESGGDFVSVNSWLGVEPENATGAPSAATTSGFRARLRFPAPAGVRAIGVCPPEVNGAPALVAVLPNELWLIR